MATAETAVITVVIRILYSHIGLEPEMSLV